MARYSGSVDWKCAHMLPCRAYVCVFFVFCIWCLWQIVVHVHCLQLTKIPSHWLTSFGEVRYSNLDIEFLFGFILILKY